MTEDEGVLPRSEQARIWSELANASERVAEILDGKATGDGAHAIALVAAHRGFAQGTDSWFDIVQSGIDLLPDRLDFGHSDDPDFPRPAPPTTQQLEASRKIRDVAAKMRDRQAAFTPTLG